MRLKIAAKVDAADRAYFHEQIEPLLDDPLIEFVGEIGDAEKSAFLGNAAALLFPIDWPEPFGLVMIEAMACGTPVIAWRCGSVPEVVEDGAHRLHRRQRGRGGGGGGPPRSARPARGPRTCSSAASRAQVMARSYLELYWRLCPRHRAAAAAERRRAGTRRADGRRGTRRPTAPARRRGCSRSSTATPSWSPTASATSLGDGDGLFHDDTRILSRFRLSCRGTAAVAARGRGQPGQRRSSPPT